MSDGDLIHDQVETYLGVHPEFRFRVRQTGDGEYDIDGRDVKVGFCRQGYLVVHDGPLRQPFTDYVEKKETTAVYHKGGLKNSSLNQVPKETRISFGDEGNRYSRLDAMKVAKEQAIFREKAASLVNEGQMVPEHLMEKYEKAIDLKLGKRRWAPKPEPKEPEGPAWWPGAPAPTAAPSPQPQQHLPMPPPQHLQQQPSGTQQHLPMPTMPPVGLPSQGNLFGHVPDLFQIVADRSKQSSAPLGTGTISMPAPVKTPLHTYTGAGLKAPMGLQHPMKSIAGPLCGA